MTSFSLTNILLNNYGKYMSMKIFIDNDDNDLKNAYINAINKHNNKIINNPTIIDAGFDIYTPSKELLLNQLANKVDFKIICACKMITQSNSYNTGFYMYPRSSISNTPLRLSNNVGIIDAGYRGHLIGMFDLPSGQNIKINKFDKYLQICAPGLIPIVIELVNSIGEITERGSGGFGSTGR